jgi:hypothetical protein
MLADPRPILVAGRDRELVGPAPSILPVPRRAALRETGVSGV